MAGRERPRRLTAVALALLCCSSGLSLAGPIPLAELRSAAYAGGLVPSVVFGVAFGNLLQGVPFRIDSDLRIFYEGSGLFELLNPFEVSQR